jgi:hypothetical protein
LIFILFLVQDPQKKKSRMSQEWQKKGECVKWSASDLYTHLMNCISHM